MFGACGGIIEAAGIGVDWCGIAVFICQHDALEAVHDALCTVGDGSGIVAEFGAAAQGLYTDQFNRICQEGGEHADGVGSAADAGCDLIRQMTGLLDKLCPCFFADAVLEIADHQREGMGTCGGSDAVDGILIFPGVGHESSVNSLFERLETKTDRDDIGTQQLHAGHVGGLFGDIDFAHVDVALETEIGGCRCQGYAVLAGACLCDEFLFAHVFGQKALAHAVVEFVGACVVQVFPLEIDLRSAEQVGEVLAVIDRCGSALEILADAAELCDKLRRLCDRVIGFCIFVEGLDQLRIFKIVPAIFAEISVLGGIFFQIVVKIAIFVHVILPF